MTWIIPSETNDSQEVTSDGEVQSIFICMHERFRTYRKFPLLMVNLWDRECTQHLLGFNFLNSRRTVVLHQAWWYSKQKPLEWFSRLLVAMPWASCKLRSSTTVSKVVTFWWRDTHVLVAPQQAEMTRSFGPSISLLWVGALQVHIIRPKYYQRVLTVEILRLLCYAVSKRSDLCI